MPATRATAPAPTSQRLGAGAGALLAVAVLAVAGCGVASPDAAGHDVDANCGTDGQVHVVAANWNDGHYSVNGGPQIDFGAGFTLTLSGASEQTVVVGSATEPTQIVHAGPCTPPTTTTVKATTTTSSTVAETTTTIDRCPPEDEPCTPNTQGATTTTGPTTTTGVTTTTSTPGATTTTTSPAAFAFGAAASVCVREVPTIVINFQNTFPELAGRVGILTMATLDGTVVSTQELVYQPGTSVSLLYPGTRVNPDGTIADVPGWILQSNGLWVRDDSDAFLREGIQLTYTVNPTATATVTYPPESSACANPSGPFPPVTPVTPPAQPGLPGTR